jgi:hypothetical protein
MPLTRREERARDRRDLLILKDVDLGHNIRTVAFNHGVTSKTIDRLRRDIAIDILENPRES